MKKALLISAAFACGAASKPQATGLPVPLRLSAYSACHADALACTANEGALALLKNFSAGTCSERKFLQPELGSYLFTAALPTAHGNFGCSGSYFGFPLYAETTIGLAYGRRLSEAAGIGVGFDYTHSRVQGYGAAAALGWSLGAMATVAPGLRAGVQFIGNAGGRGEDTRWQAKPSLVAAGFGYEPSAQCFFAVEIMKAEGRPASVNAGMQYSFAQKLFARCGLSAATGSFYLGGGVRWQQLRLDAITSFHPHLGLSPALVLLYEGGKKP